MKIKVENATNTQLNWMVALTQGAYDLRLVYTHGANVAWKYTVNDDEAPGRKDHFYLSDTDYSEDWALAGPLIESECIELGMHADQWQATMHLESESIYERGPTPLVAAMRCLVASKLGGEVEVPDELA